MRFHHFSFKHFRNYYKIDFSLVDSVKSEDQFFVIRKKSTALLFLETQRLGFICKHCPTEVHVTVNGKQIVF